MQLFQWLKTKQIVLCYSESKYTDEWLKYQSGMGNSTCFPLKKHDFVKLQIFTKIAV